MKVTAGWVEKNMGISKDTIRYWESEPLRLIKKEVFQKKSENKKYRIYDSEDLKLLWNIKFFRELGCSYKTIKLLFEENELSIVDVINECKVNLNNDIKQLEEELEKKKLLLELTTTIEETGIIPIPKEYGNIRFNDFLKESINNFNLFKDDLFSKLFSAREKLNENELTDEDIEEFVNIMKSEKFISAINFTVLLRVLGKCSSFDVNDIKIMILIEYIKKEFKKMNEINCEVTDSSFNKFIEDLFDSLEYRQSIGKSEEIWNLSNDEKVFILNAFNTSVNLSNEDKQSLNYIAYKNVFNHHLPINLEKKSIDEIFIVIDTLAKFDADDLLNFQILMKMFKERFELKEDNEEVQTIIEMIFENFKKLFFSNSSDVTALNYFLGEFGIDTFKIYIPSLTEDNIKFINKVLKNFAKSYITKGEDS